jgi:hypothetical protein
MLPRDSAATQEPAAENMNSKSGKQNVKQLMDAIEREKEARAEWEAIGEVSTEDNQVWRLPNFYLKLENRDKVIHRSNKYLGNMRKRIVGLVRSKEYRKA